MNVYGCIMHYDVMGPGRTRLHRPSTRLHRPSTRTPASSNNQFRGHCVMYPSSAQLHARPRLLGPLLVSFKLICAHFQQGGIGRGRGRGGGGSQVAVIEAGAAGAGQWPINPAPST